MFRLMLLLGVWIRAMIWGDVSVWNNEGGKATYLRNDFQPSIDLDVGEAIAHRMANVVVGTIFKPQGEQSQRVLQCVLVS